MWVEELTSRTQGVMLVASGMCGPIFMQHFEPADFKAAGELAPLLMMMPPVTAVGFNSYSFGSLFLKGDGEYRWLGNMWTGDVFMEAVERGAG